MSKGKFASAQDEAIYNIAQDGEWIGSDDFGLSATLLVQPHDLPIAGFVLAQGAYVVAENADGFVDVEFFDDESEARGALASIEADYADWYLPETAPDYQEG